jgi:hypothetical protein
VADLSLEWPSSDPNSGDFAVSSDGDILIADGDTEARQRATRRILSNPRTTLPDGTLIGGDNIFDVNYGTGVRRYIGAAVTSRNAQSIRQAIRDGLLQEDVIATNPVPTVTIQALPAGFAIVASFRSSVTGRPVATPKITLS